MCTSSTEDDMTKRITGKSMLDIIDKVYRTEGWVHQVGDVKTARVLTAYFVSKNYGSDRWVAVRR